MSIAKRWPSLADQLATAAQLYGDGGFRRVADWLDEQVSYVDNADFAAQFSDHIQLPGIAPLDYAHRHICTRRGELLGGIRFYGRDIGRPFVDVVAHSFDDLDALAAVVAHEWASFAARFMRLRTTPARYRGGDALLDMTIHVARCGQMAAPDGRVKLGPFADAAEAIGLVNARYAGLAEEQPDLARNLAPQDSADLRDWHANGDLWAVVVDGVTVGALAVAQGTVGWLDGLEIQEEVIAAEHAGHGYAASAQALWARRAAERDPERLVVGTIDRHNHASRRTAIRAGRPAVLEDVFIRIPFASNA